MDRCNSCGVRGAGRSRCRAALAVLGVALVVLGCSPTAPTGQTATGATGPQPVKSLRLGTTVEPKAGILFDVSSPGSQNPALTFHAGLTVYDEKGAVQPRLAAKVPAVEDGDWKVLPDGQMEVTWKLRPGIRWHDGTPVSIDDVALGLRVMQDDEVPMTKGSWVNLIAEIRPADEQSFVVVWRQTYILANASGPSDLVVLPRHLLGQLYDTNDKQAFVNSLYWTQDFVGLGPYRLKEWVLGSHLKATAVDDYVLGRPRIDELTFRYFTDGAPLIAALLAGDVDAIPVGSIKPEQTVTIRQAWEASGGGTALLALNGLRVLYFQYRDPNAPWVRDLRVRRALAHVQDRQTTVDTLKGGLTTVGHTLPTPDNPVYRLVEQRGLTKYDYDTRRAQQLLEESGWSRGGDGTYRNAAGQPLSVEVRTVIVAPEALQEIVTVSEWFKAAGIESPVFQVRRGGADTAELRAKTEGVFANRLDDTPDSFGRFHSALIASDANRWLGQNQFGYANPAFDRAYDQYIVTLEVGKRQGMLADMLKTAADDVLFIPMWYELGALNTAFRKGVRGPGAFNMWNVHTWDMDAAG